MLEHIHPDLGWPQGHRYSAWPWPSPRTGAPSTPSPAPALRHVAAGAALRSAARGCGVSGERPPGQRSWQPPSRAPPPPVPRAQGLVTGPGRRHEASRAPSASPPSPGPASSSRQLAQQVPVRLVPLEPCSSRALAPGLRLDRVAASVAAHAQERRPALTRGCSCSRISPTVIPQRVLCAWRTPNMDISVLFYETLGLYLTLLF